MSLEEARNELYQNWRQFNEEIRDIYTEFNQFFWIKTLFTSFVRYLLHWTRLIKCISFLKRNKGHLIQFLPLSVMFLVSLILVSYRQILHKAVIVSRWCHTKEDEDVSSCTSSSLLLFGVYYLVFMALCNYIMTCYSSPGVLNTVYTNEGRQLKWQSHCGQGGTAYISSSINTNKEKQRAALHFHNANDDMHPKQGSVFIPNPCSDFCKKCRMQRPPRTHHCSTCNRCVLQMDHHCIWFNNCIGYYNYRSFLLSLIYLSSACWYGVFIFFLPFYTIMKEQVQTKGFRMMYENGTGFLDLPMPREIWNEIQETGTLNVDIVLRIIVPFLFLTAMALTVFLKSHLRYVANGLTTLERVATITFLKKQKMEEQNVDSSNPSDQRNSEENEDEIKYAGMKIVNPFDQGVRKNFQQVFGSNLWLILLPWKVESAKPFQPHKSKFE